MMKNILIKMSALFLSSSCFLNLEANAVETVTDPASFPSAPTHKEALHIYHNNLKEYKDSNGVFWTIEENRKIVLHYSMYGGDQTNQKIVLDSEFVFRTHHDLTNNLCSYTIAANFPREMGFSLGKVQLKMMKDGK